MATFTASKSAILDFVSKKVLNTNGVSGTAGPQAAPFRNPLSQTTPFDTAVGNGLENLYYPLGFRKPSSSQPYLNLFNFFNNSAQNHAQGRIATLFGITEVAYSDISGANKGQVSNLIDLYTFVHDVANYFSDQGVVAGDIMFLPETQTFHIVRVVSANILQFDVGSLPGPISTYRDALILKIVPVPLYTVGDTTSTLGREQTFMFLDPRAPVFTGGPSSEMLDQYRLRPLMPHRREVNITDIFGNQAELATLRTFIVSNLSQNWDFQFVLYPDNGSGAPDLTKPITKTKPVIDSTVPLSDQEMLVDYADGLIHFTVPPRAGDDLNPNSVVGQPLKLWAVFASVTGFTAIADLAQDNRPQHVARGIMDFPALTPGQGGADYPSYMMLNQERQVWQMFNGRDFLNTGSMPMQGFEVGEVGAGQESVPGVLLDVENKKWEIVSKAGPNADQMPLFMQSGQDGGTPQNSAFGTTRDAVDYSFELTRQDNRWRTHGLTINHNNVVNSIPHHGIKNKRTSVGSNQGKPPVAKLEQPNSVLGTMNLTSNPFYRYGDTFTADAPTWIADSLIGKWFYFCGGEFGEAYYYEVGRVIANTTTTITLDHPIPYEVLDGVGIGYVYPFPHHVVDSEHALGSEENADSPHWRGNCFDGRYLWFAPFHSRYVLKIDTFTNDFSRILHFYSAVGEQPEGYYSGAVYDGTAVWFIPYGLASTSVGIAKLNPLNNTIVEMSGLLSSQNGAYDGGVFDGKCIWFVPHNTNVLKKLNTETLVISTIDTSGAPLGGTSASLYKTGIFDGRYVWLVPYNAVNICKIDTTTDTYELIPHGVAGTNLFSGACFDGERVWFMPYNCLKIMHVNVTNNKIVVVTFDPAMHFTSVGFDGECVWFMGDATDADLQMMVRIGNIGVDTTDLNDYAAIWAPAYNRPFGQVDYAYQNGILSNAIFDGKRFWCTVEDCHPEAGDTNTWFYQLNPPLWDELDHSSYASTLIGVGGRNIEFDVSTLAWSVTDTAHHYARIFGGDILTIGDGINTFGHFNGTTHIAFIQAFNALSASAQGLIVVLPGTYTFSYGAVIQIPAGVTLQGTNALTCRIQIASAATGIGLNADSVLKNITVLAPAIDDTVYCVQFLGDGGIVENCRFENGSYLPVGAFIYGATDTTRFERLRIHNNYFQSHAGSDLEMIVFPWGEYYLGESSIIGNNATTGSSSCFLRLARVASGSNITAQCLIANNVVQGYLHFNAINNVDINHNYCGSIVFDTNASSGCNRVQISNNIIQDSASYSDYPCLLLSGAAGSVHSNIFVNNNVMIRSSTPSGNPYIIQFSSGPTQSNIVISGNYLSGTHTSITGIQFSPLCTNLIIKDNLITLSVSSSATGYGIASRSDALTGSISNMIRVAGNHVVGGFYGFFLQETTNSSNVVLQYLITNNVFHSFLYSGIYIQGVSSYYHFRPYIHGNYVTSNVSSSTTQSVIGIYLASANYFQVLGNYVFNLNSKSSGQSVNGISAVGNTYGIIQNNVVSSMNQGYVGVAYVNGISSFSNETTSVMGNYVANLSNAYSSTLDYFINGIHFELKSGGAVNNNIVFRIFGTGAAATMVCGIRMVSSSSGGVDGSICGNHIQDIASYGTSNYYSHGIYVHSQSYTLAGLVISGNTVKAGTYGILFFDNYGTAKLSQCVCVGNRFVGATCVGVANSTANWNDILFIGNKAASINGGWNTLKAGSDSETHYHRS